MIKQCKTNGITISYEETGSGAPLILLMGLGAPASKWAPHIQAYEKHFHVYALDNRGAGRSSKPVSYAYSIEEMAQDTLGLMEALHIESAHFNGISMGGAIVQYLAVHYPEKVRSAILTNTFSHCCTSFRRAIEILREASGVLDPVTSGRLCQWMIFSQTFQEENEGYMLESELADLNAPDPMPSYAYKAQCNAILNFNITADLPKITAPVLIAGGDKDLFVPVSVTQAMHEAISSSQLYIAENGGHVQHWEQLEKYNQITLDFLLKHSMQK